jgi:hypothetical protein
LTPSLRSISSRMLSSVISQSAAAIEGVISLEFDSSRFLRNGNDWGSDPVRLATAVANSC